MSATDTEVKITRLEKLGFPPSMSEALRLRCVGVPDSARSRLQATGAEMIDDEDAAIDAVVLSTRLPPDEMKQASDKLAARVGRTIVLAHTGAERLAAELVRAGADAIVGEGNEEALIGLVDADRTPTALLASFERRFGSSSGVNGRGIDAATGLPDLRSFERRIGSLADAEEIPRVAFCKVASEKWNLRHPDAVVFAQRRRLATTLGHVAGAIGVETYATGNAEFGLIGPVLSPHDMERLGNRLVATGGMFRDRGLPLRLVIGHAGPESAHDAEELLDLARRAVEVAAVDGIRQVLGAEDLALGVSVTTELEAVVRLLDEVEPAMRAGRGHGERVGQMAAELARMRGCSPAAVSRTQLAAHLHDVGRAGLPPEAVGGPDGLTGELLESWRTFPARSAELLQLTAGPEVARMARAQRERWDGQGFPDGIEGQAIPEGARIIAVVHSIDLELATDRHVPMGTVTESLRSGAGTEFDPDVVATAIESLGDLLDARS